MLRYHNLIILQYLDCLKGMEEILDLDYFLAEIAQELGDEIEKEP